MKVKNNLYNKHFIALATLFVLGNGVITAPYHNADKYNFLAFLLCCFIAAAVYFLSSLLPINKITIPIIWLVGFFCISDAIITFVKFISDNLLPQTKHFLIVLPIILLLLYIGFRKEETVFKFSLIAFFAVVAVIIFFFFATAKDFKVSNIFIRELPTLKGLALQMLPYIKSIILPVVLLLFFARLNNFKNIIAVSGLGVGFLCFGLCLLNSILLFGIGLAGRLNYPYSSAGSTVTFGNLFTRMDGFLYFVYLACCVVKCSVGIFTIRKSFTSFKS